MLSAFKKWIASLFTWLQLFLTSKLIQRKPAMTPLSIQVPFPVFQDRDGQPLDNGYVWLGEANLNPQTNPVIVYFDAALTIIAAQPLRTINGYISRAGTPAQVYVDGVNFSILVQDSKGTMVYNFPDGSGISPNASGVVYDPAGTGAVSTTVQAKLRESVSVKDFGAVGDGVTDDTAFIQAAIDATKNSSILFFPSGIYLCSSGLTLYKGSKIEGESNFLPDYRTTTKNCTRLSFTSTAVASIGIAIDQSETESSYVWGVSIRNIYLEGVDAVSSVGIDVRSLACTIFENVGVRSFDIGLYITYGMTNTFNSLAIAQCTSSAVYIAAPLNSVTTSQVFNGCTFRESGWGITIESKATGNSFGSVFNNCLIESTTLGGANIHRSCGATFNSTYMENVLGTLYRLHKDGVAGGSNYADVVIFGGDQAGQNSGVSTNAVDIGYCRQVTITGVLFQRCTNGIVCDATNTPDNSVYVFSPEYISVTNRFVNEKNKVNGLYASAVASSARSALSYSSNYYARRSGGATDMFTATADSVDNGVKMGIDNTSQTGAITATHSVGGSSSLSLKATLTGTEYEVARVLSNGNFSMRNAGAGVSLISPNGLITKIVTIDNAGALVLL